jgi:dephospho-CoA kinase
MMDNKFRIIGITGGIGAGKSMVAKIFSTLGIPVFDADSQAKELINESEVLKNEIIKLLGPKAFLSDGQYNRKWVAEKVFINPNLLKKLNDLIHPAVREYAYIWLAKQKKSPYYLYEAALMKGAGNGNHFNKVIAVTSPLALRIERIKLRDKRTEIEIEAIISKQITDEERLQFADFVIKNDENHALIDQVLAINSTLLEV